MQLFPDRKDSQLDSPTASTSARTSPEHTPRAPSRLTLPAILAGVALVAMSISGTAVALPNIGRDLTASGSALNWVVAGYNLAFAAMTLVAGAAADRVGRRRVFTVSAAVFAVGSLATAAAPSILVVDIARFVSGIGGAGVMAAGGALLASSYAGATRNRAFALMGTMAGVGIALGPTIVGGLITLTGWRGSFLAFAVVGVVIACGAGRLRESRADDGRTDWVGSTLFVATLSAFMFALLEGPEVGWTHPATLSAFGVGAMALVTLMIAQRRSAAPMLAPELVSHRGFMGWCLATLTTSIGFLGALVFLPTYLQAVAGSAPAAAGLTMLLLTAPVLVTPLLAVSAINRGVSARLLITAALLCVVAGNLGLLTLGPEDTSARVAVPLLLIGIGMGASFGITDGQAMALVPTRLVGTAAGFLNTLRGAAEALVIAVFSAMLLGFLAGRLGDAGHAAEVAAGDLSTITDGDYRTEVDAFTAAWQLTQLGVAIVCLLLSLVVVLLLARPRALVAREGDVDPGERVMTPAVEAPIHEKTPVEPSILVSRAARRAGDAIRQGPAAIANARTEWMRRSQALAAARRRVSDGTMSVSERLMTIERRLAEGSGPDYEEVLSKDALVVVPGAVLDKAQCVAAMNESPGWDRVELGSPRVIEGPGVATVVYEFTGVRGDTTYTAVLSSSYRLPEATLYLHQQTPR